MSKDDSENPEPKLNDSPADLRKVKWLTKWGPIAGVASLVVSIASMFVIFSLKSGFYLKLNGWEGVTFWLGSLVSSTWAVVAVVALLCRRDND